LSRSIDLFSYHYEKLTSKVLKVCNTDDKALVEKVLLSCGTIIGDRYIILSQEFREDSSCYHNVSRVLGRLFKTDDVLGKVFCTCDDSETDKQDLIQEIGVCDIEEAIGADIPYPEED